MIYKTPPGLVVFKVFNLGQKYWILREELSVNNCIAVCINLLDIGAEGNSSGRSVLADNQANKTAPPHQEYFIGDLPSFWVLFLLRKTYPVPDIIRFLENKKTESFLNEYS